MVVASPEAAGREESFLDKFRKILRKPSVYDLMIAFLAILTINGLFEFGPNVFRFGLPQLLTSIGVAAALDFAVYYAKYKYPSIPKSAIITGFFIGTFVPIIPLWQVALTAAAAIISKHIIQLRGRNLFNPTAFSIVLMFFIFGSVSPAWQAARYWQLVIPLGLLIAYNFKRYGLVATFLATTFALEIGAAMIGIPTAGAFDVLRNPLNPVLYFFTMFMVVEPKTSPVSSKGRLVYGTVAATAVFAVNFFQPGIAPLLGLLIANSTSQAINLLVTRPKV